MTLTVPLPTAAAAEALGARLAARLRPGDVVLLIGDLGAGKTPLARGLIRAFLGAPGAEVPSPTYTLVQTYERGGVELWHCDLYRLQREAEAGELALEEAFEEAIVLIEWPDRIAGLLPPDRLEICLEPADSGDRRTARMVGHGEWSARLGKL
ncbi:MAG: tRNA (adenosine(37)-N6)-threonylcarbamoyltransferase complex ATPase subunit type 1 TsaE [Caulobacterales bacterium]|nr:tRNA (adenosine(37)-N6)-threonylcarbamoyltransferase complex ATPase subunit type 1 TsaE [Caulobacterales bacterium]